VLTLRMNGAAKQILCKDEEMTAAWDVAARPDAPNELVLEIAPVLNPQREHLGGDSRDLGLQLFAYDWRRE
jgi:hypothetical protein